MKGDPRFAKLLADLPEALVRESTFVHELMNNAEIITVRKGDYLVRTGEFCHHAYFINKGVYINQFINERGEENVVGFSTDEFYPFLSAIGYFTEAPSEFEVKAIEEGELVRLSRAHIEQMSKNYPLFASYYQNAMMAIIFKLYTIFAIRQSCTSEEFLHYLYTRQISFINRIPDKYIARFMGVSTSWYCKLKKRVLR